MTVLEPEERSSLVRRLLRITQGENLKWSKPFAQENSFSASTGRYKFVIESRDGDGLPPYNLHVSRGGFNEIDVIGTSLDPQNPDEVELNDNLETLYRLATRNALGVEKTVRELFDELDRLEPPPF